jgi:hypothetical protein
MTGIVSNIELIEKMEGGINIVEVYINLRILLVPILCPIEKGFNF